MKKNISILIAIFIMGISFSGCAGKSFSFHDAKTVQVGDSKETLIQKMGSNPYWIRTEQIDGQNVVKYVYVSVNGLTGATKSLSFILKEDKVIQVPHIPNELLE